MEGKIEISSLNVFIPAIGKAFLVVIKGKGYVAQLPVHKDVHVGTVVNVGVEVLLPEAFQRVLALIVPHLLTPSVDGDGVGELQAVKSLLLKVKQGRDADG